MRSQTATARRAWAITNQDGNVHDYHVHDVQLQIVAVDSQGPPPELASWDGSVSVPVCC
jgi:suppressor of ftsI